MMRVAVLASGSGSNFQALVDQLNVAQSVAHVVVLLTNEPLAGVIERARKANIAVEVVDHRTAESRQAFDAEVVARLQKHEVQLVCLAGYMRLVTVDFLKHFQQRVINVHPALLPSFPGMHGAAQALTAGVKVTGCTVHFVDEGVDTGPIIAQAAVPVLPGDTEALLSERIQKEEHRLFAAVVRALARNEVTVNGRVVTLKEPLQ